jgi:hypothetical protein
MFGIAERESMRVGRRGDAIALVSQITDALNGITGFTYDPNGGEGIGYFSGNLWGCPRGGETKQGGHPRLPVRSSERLLPIHAGAQGGEVMIDERLGAGKSSLVSLSLHAPSISEAVQAMMFLL